jgi:hypothetical protein
MQKLKKKEFKTKTAKLLFDLFRACVGFLGVIFWHFPKLIWHLLIYSYACIFNKHENLTADPKEHLKRAKHLLIHGDNSKLLYCALEIRFALERMVHSKLIFANGVSKKNLKEYDPVKKFSVLQKLEQDIDYAHQVYIKIPETNEKMLLGEYLPLETKKVKEIQGKLGDLLHPKEGLLLGIEKCEWYVETKKFLDESISYLEKRIERNEIFFAYKGLERFHVEKIEK